jgi:transcriptional regulator with XRE-family HTH domain
VAAFRRAAGLSQAELADAVGVQQQTIAFWELSDKPPRSDVLPTMAKALGVRVEDLLGDAPIHAVRKPGPAGKLQKALELAQKLPKRQQELVLQFVETLTAQRKRAS